MNFHIHWTLFLDVTSEKKCQRLLDRAREALGLPLEVIKAEQYWKDKSLFKVDARACVDASTGMDAFYLIMKAVNGLARRWIVNSPTESGVWEFAGTADRGSITIQGVDSISFNSESQIELADHGSMTMRAR